MLKQAAVIKPIKVSNRANNQEQLNKIKVQRYIAQQVQKAQDQTYIKARLARKNKLTAKVLSMLSGSAAKVRARLKHDIAGYQYDYSSYKAPEKAGDVIIAFSGARQGPNNGLDLELSKRYGKNNYAIFRPTDVDKAIAFAKTLPQGSKIYVQGLSHGGAAALKFAQSGIPIQRVITYDAVAHFMKPQVIPANVKNWYNAVAGDYNYQNKSGFFSWLPNWFKSVSSDTAVDYMGRWGQINGAHNVHVPNASHVDVRSMYKQLNKNFKDVIMKQANYKYGNMVKKAQADWLKSVTDYAKQGMDGMQQFFANNQYARPLIGALLGGISGFGLAGKGSGFCRVLAMLAGAGLGGYMGYRWQNNANVTEALRQGLVQSDRRLANAQVDAIKAVTGEDIPLVYNTSWMQKKLNEAKFKKTPGGQAQQIAQLLLPKPKSEFGLKPFDSNARLRSLISNKLAEAFTGNSGSPMDKLNYLWRTKWKSLYPNVTQQDFFDIVNGNTKSSQFEPGNVQKWLKDLNDSIQTSKRMP